MWFTTHVQSLVSTIEELGNPFEEESTDLISLVSKDVADPAMKASLNKIEEIGKNQYEAFIKERLMERSKPIENRISRMLFLCGNPCGRVQDRKKR